jgi:hypothetical protein
MEEIKNKILNFLKQNYNGSFRFVKEKMFIKNFGIEIYNLIKNETKFLDSTNYAFSVNVRSFIEDIKENPKCVVCGKLTIFNSNNGWQSTCSRSCHIQSDDRKEKLKKTNLEKYGSTNFLASKEGKLKMKETFFKKYGVDNYAKSEEYKERLKNGDIKVNKNPKLASQTSKLNYYNSLIDGDIVLPLFPFSDYEGFSNPYKSYKWKCKKCGLEFDAILKYHKYLECRVCKPTGTKMEIFIKRYLDDLNIPYIYRERNILNGYEIDVYVPNHKLGIELNGLYWHSEEHKDKNLHVKKANLADKAGIKLIQIFEDEFKQKKEIVINRLNNLLHLNENKIYARKCIVKYIDNTIKNNFLIKNHIQGNSNTSINLGLYYKEELVSVMTFSKERLALGNKKSEDDVYELNRFCSISNTTIIGGAGKLLKYFIKNYNPKKIISYADRRWSSGNLYETLGFKFINNTNPNYWYTNNFINREHRFKYRKNVLKDKLENYDPNLTEIQNMNNNGYVRIWDAGNKKYVMCL